MTALLVVVGLAPPIVAAWAALDRVLPLRRRGPVGRALSLALATIAGTGLATLLTYAWLVAGGELGPGYAAFDSAAFVALAALAWRAPRAPPERAAPLSRAETAALALAAVAALVLVAAIAARTWAAPHGEWDAWAIWNQRARFLFRAGTEWRLAFVDPSAHPGYPPLVPLAVARLWCFAGESPVAPFVLACAFTVGTVVVVVCAVALRSGAVAGSAAGLLLTGTEAWMRWGSSQYADAPLAAFVACAAAFLVIGAAEPAGRWRAVALAGVSLGLAAFTKDEGIVLAAGFAGCVVAARHAFDGAGRWGRAVALAAGAALPVLARLHFQATIAPSFAQVFTGDQTAHAVVARLADPARWSVVLGAAARYLPGRSLPLPLVAVAIALLLGAPFRAARRSPVVAAVLAVWAAYLLVYASTPLPLEWHIATSMERVLVQPWPALLIGLLALSPAPSPEPLAAGAGAR